MGVRKKICPKCGRKLWPRDFYKTKATGQLSSYCIDCMRVIKREEYRRNRKKPDKLFVDPDTGRVMEHRGLRTTIYWSNAMIEKLKRLYAATKNEDLVIEFNVSLRTLIRQARKLGLQKDPDWLREQSRQNCRLMRVINMCCKNAGMIKPGHHKNPDGEFEKGVNNRLKYLKV